MNLHHKRNPGDFDVEQAARTFLSTTLKLILTHPEELQLKFLRAQRTLMIEVIVNDEDIGIVLGAKGRNIKAIQTILNCLGAKGESQIICTVFNPKNQS